MSNPLHQGWGEFLSDFEWDWFVTLTFEGDVKTFTAHRRCTAWLRSLEKAASMPIAWFRGDEYGSRTGRFHLHLLVANVAHLHRFTWMNRWASQNGFARILPYDSSRGAAFYVSKYVTKQLGEWEISDNLTAFRVGQPMLKLTGQVGVNQVKSRVASPRPKPRKRGVEHLQKVLSDFTDAPQRSPETTPLRAHIAEQTRFPR